MTSDAPPISKTAVTGDFQTGRVLTLSGAHAVHDTYTAFLPPMLPVFIENLAMSRTEAGLLTVFNQGPSLLQPVIGHLSDHLSLRLLVILAPGITATTMSLLGVAPSYVILAFFLTIAGLSSAALHAIAPVMAGRLSGPKLGQGMSFWMVGGEIGRFLGPLVIVAAISWLGLTGTPWLMIGGWVTTALLLFRLKDVPARAPGAAPALPWRAALRAMSPVLVPLTGIVVIRGFTSASLTTFLPVFLTEEGAELWFAGISLSVLEAAGVVGALLGGTLSDRLGRRTMLFFSMAFTPVFMFAFVYASDMLRFPLLLLLGLAAISITPVIMAIVQESVPENRALANGVYMSVNFAIRSVIVVIVGALGDAWGMRAAFLFSAAIPLIGLPLLRFLPNNRG
ncbi:MAG TPA: MFS transporter [Anaerolineae bacterium]|nr:MFS transporter [Anaerolineae bacterium]